MRLIDAGDIIIACVSEIINEEPYIRISNVDESIDRTPTAYDVDEVVEQLEELSKEHPYKVPGEPDTYSQYNEAWEDCSGRAIEIVKGGARGTK